MVASVLTSPIRRRWPQQRGHLMSMAKVRRSSSRQGMYLFLALGYHHYGAGAFNAVFGSAIGEAIILTQPTGTIDDLALYQRGALGSQP